MEDMRDYRKVIRHAVSRERHKDKRWSWRVQSVTKSAAKIGWGYLDFLSGDKKTVAFSVNAECVGGCVPCVVGTAQDGYKRYVDIGSEYYDGARTTEQGIIIAIQALAAHMRKVY